MTIDPYGPPTLAQALAADIPDNGDREATQQFARDLAQSVEDDASFEGYWTGEHL